MLRQLLMLRLFLILHVGSSPVGLTLSHLREKQFKPNKANWAYFLALHIYIYSLLKRETSWYITLFSKSNEWYQSYH